MTAAAEPSPPAPEVVLRLQAISKRFGPLLANDDISLDLHQGEVLALLGENGAGKSTLVSILFGHYVADAGHIEVMGQRLPPGQPKAALAMGIGMVHQHFTLAHNMSVLDNLLLGTEPLWWPFSRRAAARAQVLATADRFGLAVNPDALIADLSVGERQRVEILKALVSFGGRQAARILILDEPTAVLTPAEAESLFATLRQLVDQGLSVIFISHKLDEVLRVSQRIAILRSGRLVAVMPAADADKPLLAQTMVGHDVQMPKRRPRAAGAAVCVLDGASVEGANGRKLLDGVDLDVRAGEIVAIAGVAGNGQQALADLLFGLRPLAAGRLELVGAAAPPRPASRVRAGVARIPEDRHDVGVVADLPVWENAVLERYADAAFSRFGVIDRRAAMRHAQVLVERFDVRGTEAHGVHTPTRALSGGNMQKLILGRVLMAPPGEARPPSLIVADQPTWGLDIGAVAFVHRQLLDACGAGAAVLLISEDLEEIFALADRIAVLHAGRLSVARPAAAWTLPQIGLAMAGSSHAH